MHLCIISDKLQHAGGIARSIAVEWDTHQTFSLLILLCTSPDACGAPLWAESREIVEHAGGVLPAGSAHMTSAGISFSCAPPSPPVAFQVTCVVAANCPPLFTQ